MAAEVLLPQHCTKDEADRNLAKQHMDLQKCTEEPSATQARSQSKLPQTHHMAATESQQFNQESTCMEPACHATDDMSNDAEIAEVVGVVELAQTSSSTDDEFCSFPNSPWSTPTSHAYMSCSEADVQISPANDNLASTPTKINQDNRVVDGGTHPALKSSPELLHEPSSPPMAELPGGHMVMMTSSGPQDLIQVSPSQSTLARLCQYSSSLPHSCCNWCNSTHLALNAAFHATIAIKLGLIIGGHSKLIDAHFICVVRTCMHWAHLAHVDA